MRRVLLSLSFVILQWSLSVAQTAVNDNNTPLHLMKPAYRVGYGVSKPADVKAVMDRVLNYIDAETPAALVDKNTDEAVTDYKKITADTRLKQGGFRLTSYEWGVTYSGALAAYEATGDKAYKDYVAIRHQLLADIAPYYRKIYEKNKDIDVNVRRVIDPHALDDAGAVCCSMIKATLMASKNSSTQSNLSPLTSHLSPLTTHLSPLTTHLSITPPSHSGTPTVLPTR